MISTLSRRCSVKRRRSAVFARVTDGLVDRAPISYGGSSPREVSAPPCPARGLSPWPFVPPMLDRQAVRAGATTNRGAHRDTPTRTRTPKSGTVKARALPSIGPSGVLLLATAFPGGFLKTLRKFVNKLELYTVQPRALTNCESREARSYIVAL